jgi:hypothetical protein
VHLGSACSACGGPAHLVCGPTRWRQGTTLGHGGAGDGGDSGKPAPEVGGEHASWQGSGVVDRFEARKRLGGGGSPELSVAALVAGGETTAEARTGGRGGRRLGRVAARRYTGARVRVGWGFRGPGRRCTVVPQRRHGSALGGGGRRKEKGSFIGSGSLYSG